MHLYIKELTDTENRLVVPTGMGGKGGGMDWALGVGRCKPLYLEWISRELQSWHSKNKSD